LQVIDRDTSQPLSGFRVNIKGGVRRDIELVTDPSGMVVASEKVDRLARVTISVGGKSLVQFPAPIIDDRVLVCEISTQPDAENLARLEVRRQQLIVRILGTLHVVDQRFSELGILLGQSYEESLEYAKRTLAFLDSEIAYIRDERAEIKQIDAKRKSSSPAHDDADKGLKRLKDLRGDVGDLIARITQNIAERDRQTEKQNKAAKLVEQAALLESQAQFDEAIEVYQAAVQLVPNEPKVAKRLESLRADWALKGDPHKQARKFVLETWPKVDVQVVKEHLAGAQKALDECRDAGDRLTPRRFLMTTGEHLAKISRIVETLKQSRSIDDRQRLKAWQETVETLRRLTNQAIEQVEPSAAKK
jgi:tetratricopeptide (TPR) repeat protein